MKLNLTHARHLIRETRGAEIAEAAAVLPLMFMMLLGIFWFGQAFSIYGAITRAAQEGARAGAFPYCATCIASTNTLSQYATNAVTATQTALTASNLDINQAQWPATTPPVVACVNGATTCANASNKVCVQLPVVLSTTHQRRRRRLRRRRHHSISISVLAALHLAEQAAHLTDRFRPRAHGDALILISSFHHPRPTRAGAIAQPCRNDRGAQLVEFAVALPLLVLFVVGIFDFSNAFTFKQKLTNIARDAARVAAADPAGDLRAPSTTAPASVIDAFQVIDTYSDRQQDQRLRHLP